MAKIDNFEIDTIYNEDCLATMKRMPDGFVDLVVTSPPYDNLREYNGFSFDFESIAKELYRVTKDGGVVVWIVNDATINGSETGTSFKQALYFKEIGFNLHDTMIWEKTTVLPRDTRIPRYWQAFEYMFVFSKGKPQHFTFLREKCKKAGEKRTGYGGRSGNNDSLREDRKEKNSEGNYIRETKPRGNIWEYTPATNPNHPAVFPEQLASDHIKSWSNEGDLVYDCFLGSGTTALMAIKNNRHFIGSEISKEYFDIAERRIKFEQAQLSLF